MTRLMWYPGHELLLPDIVRAENCHLFDSAGRRYVDLESGVWCTSIGHGHPRIRKVIAEQGGKIAHTGFGYSSPVVREAAEEVLPPAGLAGGHCVFLCSGSEAVEYGVRVAQMLSTRPLLMTMNDSYCGAYGSARHKNEDEWFCFDWSVCESCPESKNCSDGCPHWDDIPFDRIGGFLFEPGSSSGLVRFPPVKLIGNIIVAVRSADGLVLVNEVTTGVGRTGAWFGHQHYNFVPDIIALGKGIGNGYPVSATLLASRVSEQLGGRQVPYAQSHQNDPLGAVVAREVVRVITEDNLVERGRQAATRLQTGLEKIRESSGRIREIRGRGLMIALEMEDDGETSFTIKVHRTLVERGFIVGRRPGVPVLRLDPALTMGFDEIRQFLETLEEVVGGKERSIGINK